MALTRKSPKGREAGVTLVEILVAVFILTIGILSCLLYFSAAMNSMEFARDVTVATTHGEYILEDMRARATLNDITGANWPEWVETTGLNTLPAESIAIVFADPTADPLGISVTVNWVRGEKANSVNLQTELTK